MSVAIVLPTHNRLEYTKKTVERLLSDKDEQFELYLWDNASTDETAKFLKSLRDERIVDVYISKANEGQVGAMNWAWKRSKAELVGKLDNDCLVTPGWTKIFAEAHRDIEKLGALACWHFFEKDFDGQRAEHKIQRFGEHQIFRHPWVCGSGFIMKKSTYEQMGDWPSGANVGTTGYFLKMAMAGFVNGWYYPLVYQEHMDDPLSQYCHIKNVESFRKNKDITFGLRSGNYTDIQGRLVWRQKIIDELIESPYEASYYRPYRRKLRRLKTRIKKIITNRESKTK